MTQKQLLIVGGVVALAVLLFAAKATYPRWGMFLNQSEGQ